jgi:hypothetical protein
MDAFLVSPIIGRVRSRKKACFVGQRYSETAVRVSEVRKRPGGGFTVGDRDQNFENANEVQKRNANLLCKAKEETQFAVRLPGQRQGGLMLGSAVLLHSTQRGTLHRSEVFKVPSQRNIRGDHISSRQEHI